ncbi:HPP family protein [Rhodoferax sp. WC2427]|uniref:HPP family protein n=1 Tax=Rhodoferax sp. WC2427 TaxID=3234144 RepID=UPI003466D3B3
MKLSPPLWLLNLYPPSTSVNRVERLRACLGALLGIALTGWLSAQAMGLTLATVWLIAPMGASAVLLFAQPASPLAQPWSIVGGNLVAACIGVSCAKLLPAPVPAAAAAIFFSIGAMFWLRCLHPPSGAIALTAVLGGPQIHAAGYGFIAAPVALNTAVLLLAALLYNNATGRRYPHAQRAEIPHPHQTQDTPPTTRLGFTTADLQAVLKDYNQVLDISFDDLELLFHRTETQAFRRRFGATLCGDAMSRDVRAVEFATELDEAWHLMHTHRVQALPVIDRARRVIGIVTRSHFLSQLEADGHPALGTLGTRLRALLQRTPFSHSRKPEVVGQIMASPVKTAFETTPLVELVPWMVDAGMHHVPVVDAERRLVGMVTQTDLMATLYETSLAHLG